MNVLFSDYIKIPSNSTEWSSQNEGVDRINIELIKSEATQTLVYD